MLAVRDLRAGYGRAEILRGMNLCVAPGETVVLLGRNGAGKSTTLKAVIGLVRPTGGEMVFEGVSIGGMEPARVARMGIGYVPEERRVFAELTVAENLETGRKGQGWTPEALLELFPNLAVNRYRRAGGMSGGEQQMLSIARTLMGNPRLLLLDEPSEGLAPVIVDAMVAAVRRLKAHGVAILLAEQNLRFAEAVGDRAVRIERGVVTG